MTLSIRLSFPSNYPNTPPNFRLKQLSRAEKHGKPSKNAFQNYDIHNFDNIWKKNSSISSSTKSGQYCLTPRLFPLTTFRLCNSSNSETLGQKSSSLTNRKPHCELKKLSKHRLCCGVQPKPTGL